MKQLTPRQHNVLSYSSACVTFSLFYILFYSSKDSKSYDFINSPKLCLFLWNFHFLRRTIESAFIHRYGKSHIPISDTIEELIYYNVFSIWIASSLTMITKFEPQNYFLLIITGIIIFIVGETGNTICHFMLRQLKSPLQLKHKKIPHGFMFEYVSCPHYFFEITSWIGFSLITTIRVFSILSTKSSLDFFSVLHVLGAAIFNLLGAGILISWATNHHKRYLSTFDNYPRNRKVIIPFIY
eukprot:gb/GECH01004763.1/.p1 GENE.gb/GECH01004763.1/~~gb/GECH01004763.1/.p1  ORF type:complete len:240 (+),score=25.18 gb/GECH01004763.1/:1-720(+)